MTSLLRKEYEIKRDLSLIRDNLKT